MRGKHSKTFAFQRKLKEDGIKLTKRRKRLQWELKQAIKAADPHLVKELITKAEAIKGTILLMDAKHAEKWLERYWERYRATQFVQRMFRGYMGRLRAMKKRAQDRLAAKRKFELEATSAHLSRIVVPNFLALGIKKAKLGLLNPPMHKVTENMAGELVIVTVHSDKHADYSRRREVPVKPCVSCGAWAPRKRFEPSVHGFVLSNGPCSCISKISCESIRLRAYHPESGNMYELSVSEREVRKRLREAVFRGKIDPSSRLACIVYLGKVDTDPLMKFNVGPYRRDRFEPINEASIARNRSVVQHKLAALREKEATQAEADGDAAEQFYSKTTQEVKAAKIAFQRAHEDLVSGLVYEQAYIIGADDAMAFSKRQVELLANLDQGNTQQSWDPLENASTHRYLKMKRIAIKTAALSRILREEARVSYVAGE